MRAQSAPPLEKVALFAAPASFLKNIFPDPPPFFCKEKWTPLTLLHCTSFLPVKDVLGSGRPHLLFKRFLRPLFQKTHRFLFLGCRPPGRRPFLRPSQSCSGSWIRHKGADKRSGAAGRNATFDFLFRRSVLGAVLSHLFRTCSTGTVLGGSEASAIETVPFSSIDRGPPFLPSSAC